MRLNRIAVSFPWSIIAILISTPLLILFFWKTNDLRIYSDSVTYLVAADNFLRGVDFLAPTSRPVGFAKIWSMAFHFQYSGQAILLIHTLFLVFSVLALSMVLLKLGYSSRKVLYIGLVLELNPQCLFYLHTALAESFSYSLLILVAAIALLKDLYPKRFVFLSIFSLLFFAGLVVRYTFFWYAGTFLAILLISYLKRNFFNLHCFFRFLQKITWSNSYFILFSLTVLFFVTLFASFLSESKPTELLLRPFYASTFTNLAKVSSLIDCRSGSYSTPLMEICSDRSVTSPPFVFDGFLYDSKVQAISNINPSYGDFVSIAPMRRDVFEVILGKPLAYIDLLASDLVTTLNPLEEEYIGRVDTEDSPYSYIVDQLTSRNVGTNESSDTLFTFVSLQTFLRLFGFLVILLPRYKRGNLEYFYLLNLGILVAFAFPTPRYLFPMDAIMLITMFLKYAKKLRPN